MQADLVAVLVLAVCATCRASTTAAQERADAEASGSSFFDTFMAFLGSSTLGAAPEDSQHHQDPAGSTAGGRDSAASTSLSSAGTSSGRSLAGDLSDGVPSTLLDGNGERVKRTGQIPAQLLGSVISHKLGYLSKGSHHVHYHNYGTKCEKPHWSLWEFKKALLGKLLEAAKAIGGGVLALKGKLITAKGHLVAAKGRKLAHKGEELTEFGKSILAKALGHGPAEEVHTAPSAPAAPLSSAHYTAPGGGYGAVPSYGAAPGYSAPQYLPPHPQVPTGYGYGEAVSLLNEYSRGGYASSPFHRSGPAPSGPSATGSAGTLPGNLQAGLLVLQPAPAASTTSLSASGPAASEVAARYSAPPQQPRQGSPTKGEGEVQGSLHPTHPLVFAPEYVNAMSAAQHIAEAAKAAASESNKVRRYAMFSNPADRRSLDDAMATVVRGLHGSHLLLNPSIVRSAASRISGV